MNKVLIVTYYWPPSGGGGVQRWLKFVKYLPEYDIDPIVVIPENPEYPVIDNSLLSDVSPDLAIIRIPIWEPYSLFKRFTGKKKEENVNTGLLSKGTKKSLTEKISIWLRGNVLIPDPRVFWVRPVKKQLVRYLKKSTVDTIITTGPPHSVHLIGLGIKKRLKNIKWVADFRDPWSEIDYLEEFNPSFIARRIQKKLENKVLTRADEVVTVSHNWAKDLERLGAKSVSVITNGYDEEDFKSIPLEKTNDNFVMLYSGILHDYRNPEYLWEVIDNILETEKEFAEKFILKLFGTIDERVIEYIQKLPNLSQRFIYGGYVSHKQILKEYQQADLLLLLQNNSKNALGHIPGKLFEYLASKKIILAIGPSGNSDVSRIISQCDAGVCCNFGDRYVLSEFLVSIFKKNLDNNEVQEKNISEQYSRKNLTKYIAEYSKKQNRI